MDKLQRAIQLSLLALSLSLPGCAPGSANAATAPQPAKPINMAQFFTGRWYEIARTPMSLTKNCVAGTTDYLPGPNGELVDRDACRMGSPEGRQKVFQGPVSILNPGQNNKVTVRYTVYGFIPVSKTYWMLDHGDDYQWFIVSNPAFTNLSIFTRSPRPAPALVARLTARVQALGYNPNKLEYPEEFPSAAAAD